MHLGLFSLICSKTGVFIFFLAKAIAQIGGNGSRLPHPHACTALLPSTFHERMLLR